MWPRWNKPSPGAATATADPNTVSTPKTPSFKDIQSLLLEDNDLPIPIPIPNPNPNPKKPSSIFHRVRIASSTIRSWKSLPRNPPKRIVLYHTSLRVVRKTFEDCRAVRSILRGFRVAVDERDLSMDSSFLAELRCILGKKRLSLSLSLSLPLVFIGGRYVGGAEEVQQLHESGELKDYVEGVPAADAGPCDGCGGVRFVLCGACDGSHRYYHYERAAFRTCPDCNENGLVRCPNCYDD